MLSLFKDLLNWTGSNNTSGNQYGFWSGFGSDLGEIAILGALITGFRHVNCSVPRCPRIGRHPVTGTHYHTCHKHATPAWHKFFRKDHSVKYPEQHKLLNK